MLTSCHLADETTNHITDIPKLWTYYSPQKPQQFHYKSKEAETAFMTHDIGH